MAHAHDFNIKFFNLITIWQTYCQFSFSRKRIPICLFVGHRLYVSDVVRLEFCQCLGTMEPREWMHLHVLSKSRVSPFDVAWKSAIHCIAIQNSLISYGHELSNRNFDDEVRNNFIAPFGIWTGLWSSLLRNSLSILLSAVRIPVGHGGLCSSLHWSCCCRLINCTAISLKIELLKNGNRRLCRTTLYKRVKRKHIFDSFPTSFYRNYQWIHWLFFPHSFFKHGRCS